LCQGTTSQADELTLDLLVWEKQGACTMHITSPFFVVPVIIAVFVVSILFATGTKEDKPSEH
jgi:hypothetical protein